MSRRVNQGVFVLLAVITLALFSGCTAGKIDEELELGLENEKFAEQTTNQSAQTIPAPEAVFGVASDVQPATTPVPNLSGSAVFGVRSAITPTTPPPATLQPQNQSTP